MALKKEELLTEKRRKMKIFQQKENTMSQEIMGKKYLVCSNIPKEKKGVPGDDPPFIELLNEF